MARKFRRRLISTILCVSMILGQFSTQVFASEMSNMDPNDFDSSAITNDINGGTEISGDSNVGTGDSNSSTDIISDDDASNTGLDGNAAGESGTQDGSLEDEEPEAEDSEIDDSGNGASNDNSEGGTQTPDTQENDSMDNESNETSSTDGDTVDDDTSGTDTGEGTATPGDTDKEDSMGNENPSLNATSTVEGEPSSNASEEEDPDAGLMAMAEEEPEFEPITGKTGNLTWTLTLIEPETTENGSTEGGSESEDAENPEQPTTPPVAPAPKYKLTFEGSGNIPYNFISNQSALSSYKDSIHEIVLPATLAGIDTYAFRNMTGLEKVTFLKDETTGRNAMTYMYGAAFYGCSSLKTINLEDTLLKTMGSGSSSSYAVFYGTAITELKLPYTLETISQYSLSYMSELKEVEFEVDPDPNGTQRNHLKLIDNNAFYYDKKLTTINLEKTSLETLGSGTGYKYCFGNTAIETLTIPNTIENIGKYAFFTMNSLKTLRFENGGTKPLTISENYALYVSTALEEIVFPDNLVELGPYSVYYNSGLKRVTLPANLTAVGNQAFSMGAIEHALEVLRIDSKELTTFGTSNSSVFREGGTYSFDLIIGNNVDKITANVFEYSAGKTRSLVFEGPNELEILPATCAAKMLAPLAGLEGKYYVTEAGELYKLTENGAELTYIPSSQATSYTVPAKVDGYDVVGINGYAFKNTNITEVTFADSSKVILKPYAFTESKVTSVKGAAAINTAEYAEVSILCGFPIATNETVKVEEISHVISSQGSGDLSLGITCNKDKLNSTDGSYHYLTGESSVVWFRVNNPSNIDMKGRHLRIYVGFEGDGYNLGSFPAGSYTLQNTVQGVTKEYPMVVAQTEVPGVFYFDITGIEPGDTLAFNNAFFFQNISSDGGTMKIWCTDMTDEQAEAIGKKVVEPTKYMEMIWETRQNDFSVQKYTNNLSNAPLMLKADGTADGKVYLANAWYRFYISCGNDTATTNGKDYVIGFSFEDTINLPTWVVNGKTEGIVWDPAIVEAIEAGRTKVKTTGSGSSQRWYFYVILTLEDGTEVEREVFYVSRSDQYNPIVANSMHVTTDREDGKISIGFDATAYSTRVGTNSAGEKYANVEFQSTSYYLYFGDKVFLVTNPETLEETYEDANGETKTRTRTLSITNDVTEVHHYSFGEDRTSSASSPSQVVNITSGLKMTKAGLNTSVYLGNPESYTITLLNQGLVPETRVGSITDSLTDVHYIKPQDLAKMFLDQTVNPGFSNEGVSNKLGSRLSVTIYPATICETVSSSAATVDIAADKISASLFAQNTGVDIPYHGCATVDGSEISTDATIKLYWNGDKLTMAVSYGDVSHIRELGSSSSTEEALAAAIKAAFNEEGYVVTRRSAYSVEWSISEKDTLLAGSSWKFIIPSTVKDTTMMLEEDTLHTYYNETGTSTNTAYAYGRPVMVTEVVNGEEVQVERRTQLAQSVVDYGNSSYYKSFTWRRDLYLYKDAYVNGQQVVEGALEVTENDVVDYTLTFTNRGSTYELLPLVDKIQGAQVLLVPVEGNDNAKIKSGETETLLSVAAQNKELDVEVIDTISYYILDKVGVYTGVVVGGKLTDSITVTRGTSSETSLAGLDTLIKWYFKDFAGYNSSNYPSYTTDAKVSYKTLISSKRTITAESTEDNTVSFPIDNETWLGDHQTHRLYASMPGEVAVMEFVKWILEDDGSLVRYSQISEGEKVTYKITIHNAGGQEASIAGNRIWDELPKTSDIFEWAKAGDTSESQLPKALITSVTYKSDNNDASVTWKGTEGAEWSITNIQPKTGATVDGQYYMVWDQNFVINFNAGGTIDFYITLEFPGDDEDSIWNQYLQKNNGALLFNTFYLDYRASAVTHELGAQGLAVLRKGVYDTGTLGSSYYESRGTRSTYANGTDSIYNYQRINSMVTYYVALYNSGRVRLYLDDLQDQLPRGFHIAGLTSIASTTNASTYTGSLRSMQKMVNTEPYDSYYSAYNTRLCSVTDETVKYVNASVTYGNVFVDADGKEHVSFSIGKAVASQAAMASSTALKYDDEVGKFYLNPGEAIRFGYNCVVDTDANTDDNAINTIVMPYYDYYGMGVDVDDADKILPTVMKGVNDNDGDCEVLGTVTMDEIYHYDTKRPDVSETTQWLMSNVSLTRGSSVPGLQKTIGGVSALSDAAKSDPYYAGTDYYNAPASALYGSAYTGSIRTEQAVNWKLRILNESNEDGGNSMSLFSIEDTMDAPFFFAGSIFYNIYNGKGERLNSSSIQLARLGKRDADANTFTCYVQSSSNSWSGTNGQYEKDIAIRYYDSVSGKTITIGYISLTQNKDKDGKVESETLKIRFTSPLVQIPAGGYMDLCLHSMVPQNKAVVDNQYLNRASLIPSEHFDPDQISNGSPFVDENTQEMGIRSSANVALSMGYATSAYKKITEIGTENWAQPNTARSDGNPTFITLSAKDKTFKYDLYVNTPKSNTPGENINYDFSRLVICDALPYVGDHAAFDPRELRESKFKVSFLEDNLGIGVYVIRGNGTIIDLMDEQSGYTDNYKIYLSDKYEFTNEDWEAKIVDGNWVVPEGWTEYTDSLSKEFISRARSIRIVIIEDTGELMHGGSQIRISFNGKIDDPNALAGQIAWNSFGYSGTTLTGSGTVTLNATPLKVGIRYPYMPMVEKQLTSRNDGPYTTNKDEVFEFLIYEGTALDALNNYQNMTIEEIITALGNVKYLYVPVTIKTGESEAITLALDKHKISKYENGQWTDTSEEWIWMNQSYTIIELPNGDPNYQLVTIGEQTNPQYTFTQNSERKIVLRAINKNEDWSLFITKHDEALDPLADAVFGLYVKEGEPDTVLTYAALAEKITELGIYEPVSLTIEHNGYTWHLLDLIMSDGEGIAVRHGILAADVLIDEVQSPEGYIRGEEFHEVFDHTQTHYEVTLINHPLFIELEKEYDQVFLGQTNAETGEAIHHTGSVAGAEFTLYAASDTDRTTPLGKMVTDENGFGFLDPHDMTQGLMVGTYVLVETNAPEGYLKTQDLSFKIDKEGKIFDLDDQPLGEIVVKDSIALGSIKITKAGDRFEAVGEEKAWYEEVGDWFVKVWNLVTGKTLEGAVFEIYTAENLYVPGTEDLILKKDTLIAELTTDKNGEALVENLPMGSYYAIETRAPEGYQLNSERREILLAAEETENGDSQIVTFELTHENIFRKVNVEVTKVDAEDEEILLKGATFGIYATKTLEDVHGKIVFEEGDLLDTAVTNEEGRAVFKKDLPCGEYVVRELTAPVGYELDEETEYVITVSEEDYADSAVATKSIVVENEKILIDISVSKEWDDADDKDAIRPEKVTILLMVGDEEIDSVELQESNDWAHTFEGLVAYADDEKISYTVLEKDVADGYTVKVEGSMDEGFVVTNHHTPEPEPEPEPEKPEESKPEEPKPEESKPEESKPEESKPEESKPEKEPDANSKPVQNEEESSVESANGSKDVAPNTGDTMNVGLWAGIMVASLAVVVALFLIGKKKKED